VLRIVHCDDSEAYRRLVELMLAEQGDLEVIASVSEHALAVEEAQRTQPDVVLLDARVPGGSDQAVMALRSVAPQAAVVILSGLDNPDNALRRAADAFVLKSRDFDEIAAAIRAAARPQDERARFTPYGRGAGADDDIGVVRRIYDAFARRDLEEALRHAADDVELMPHGTASLVGRSEPYRGHDGIRQYFADAQRVWDDLRIRARDFRATGGGVVVFGSVEGTSDGRRLRRRVVWVWQVRDGLATSMRVTDIGEAVDAG
jgi:ketosteroid isomerase-like protein/CheY-like chemotaxis protein